MSIDSRTTKQPARPSYPQPTLAEKTAMALASLLVNCALLGGMVSLFEIRGEKVAMARASVKTQPSPEGLAVRKVAPGSGG